MAKNEHDRYLYGFGSQFQSEALPGALPVGQNSPKECPYGLYAEQLSGTAFTVPPPHNLHTWLYRILPSVCHRPFAPYSRAAGSSRPGEFLASPNQFRWSAFPIDKGVDFVDGLHCLAAAGAPEVRHGVMVHIYGCTQSMERRAFYNADGDFLIVPQEGEMSVKTEMGIIDVRPLDVCVIPRGVRFQVLVAAPARGYVLEVQGGHFELPALGPIGANGLASPHDFAYPRAAWERDDRPWHIVNKYCNEYFIAEQDHSPFDVVAWKGSYAPFKYDLRRFQAINTVTHDHCDPSIFTVLTAPSATPGTALADFVIFPPRWSVAEHTFRPPYYHRNCMTEFMGLITGSYEAKGDAFAPGGASLHSCMTPHGPDVAAYTAAIQASDDPARVADGTMAFMFETSLMLRTSQWAVQGSELQPDYWRAWSALPANFKAPS